MEFIEPSEMGLDKNFDFIRIIGVGAYGLVCEYLDRSLDIRVAIKKLINIKTANEAKRALREITFLTRFKHPNILSLLKVIVNNNDKSLEIYLETALMDSDLHQLVSKNRTQLLDSHIKYIFYQLFTALQYIHSGGVAHRDVKPSNIFIDSDCTVALGDFGMAKYIEGTEELTSYIMNRCYRAPEVMLCPKEYTIKIDIWAAGCCLYEVLVGEPLFVGESYLEILELIFRTLGFVSAQELSFVTNKKALEFLNSLKKTPKKKPSEFLKEKKNLLPAIDPLAFELLDLCLEIDPKKRITSEDAMRHPFFASDFNEKDIKKMVTKLDMNFENLSSFSFDKIREYVEHEIEVVVPNLDHSLSNKDLYLLEDNNGMSAIIRLSANKLFK